MTVAYFDAGVLLSILLNERSAADARSLWLHYPQRVSSILFEAECLTTLRRAAPSVGRKKAASDWLREKSAFLAERMQEITVQHVDSNVLSRLRDEPALGACRTFDAVHLATALYFRERTDDGLVLISLDKRMRETAALFKFPILPA